MCWPNWGQSLTTTRRIQWALRGEQGIHALRVAVGKGSVTMLNAVPFQYREFLLGDNPHVFVAATQIRRGDTLRFLTEEESPSIVALMWRFGAPAVLLLAGVALGIWRSGPRFGPRVASTDTARRSLAEQIRGAVRSNTALIGIHTGGVWLAERLHADLGLDLPLGSLDVSFYRDDFEQRGLRPQVRPSTIPFEVDGRDLILVDDVLHTGRTIRAALDALVDVGRPKAVRLAVLVDRGHRELPIRADHVGKNVPTSRDEVIKVHLREVDEGDDDVVIERRSTEAGEAA